MRAAAFNDLTGPGGVSIIDRPSPEPESGEVILDVEARSLNHHDLLLLEGDSGLVDTDDLPFIGGLDAAGTISEVGEGVTTVESGDRVVLCPNQTCGSCRFCREGPENLCENFSLFHGAFAEEVAVPADRLVVLPQDVTTTTAAALPTAYMTAYHMLRRAEVNAADLVFVPGVTGGVGVAAVQIADVLGARTVGTSTSADKLEHMAEIGLDHGIRSADPDEIRNEVQAIGEADAAINHLGGAYTQVGLDVLRRNGRMVACGRTAGRFSEIDVSGLALRHKHLIGSSMGTQVDLENLVELVAAGDLDPVIDETYALTETADAFDAMQDRSHVGKLIVTSR